MALVEFVEMWILSAASLAMMERMQDIGPCKFSSFHHSQTTSMTKLKVSVLFFLLFPPGFVATNRAHLSSRRRQWRRGNIADASGMWIECSVCISTLQTWCCCGAQRVVQDVPFVWLLWSTYILRGASLCCGDEQCWPPFREIFIDFLLLPVWATGVSHRKW